MNLIDLHRVQVASSTLQERALDRYELLISEINEADITWEQFRERFELKFVPEAEKVTLARRFIDLVQGEASVTDYVASFEYLSKYGVEYISTPLKKNQRFVYGLNKNLKKPLLLKLEVPFDQLIDIALHLEEADRENDVEVVGSKPNFNNRKRPNKFKGPYPSKKGKQATPAAKTFSSTEGKCFNCGSRDHFTNKCSKPRTCCYCKSPDHYLSSCPKLQNRKEGKLNVAQAPGNTSRGQGIYHSILDVIIIFRDQPIRVLFDTGASHSFISKELVDTFSLSVVALMTSLRIANPVGGSATLSLLCKDVEIIFGDFPFLADLHVMRYLGFGMILGMDWLNHYEAHILCPERTIYLRHPQSIKQISIILKDSDSTLSASLYSLNPRDDDNDDEEHVIALIHVVREFSDIFEPVSGLPPKRAIEFKINLIPGAQPITRPPYRMSNKENEEMRKQLSELETKQFIRSSSSPW